MTMIDFDIWEKIPGFMDEAEVWRLYELVLEISKKGPVVEIGSYCGKSGYVIGCACRETGQVLYTVDHHRGSEEQQKGEEYFDPDLYDAQAGRVNTFPFLEQTIEQNHLQDTVVPIVAPSSVAGRSWATPISMLFIDGGHSYEAALTDYQTWSDHILPGGYLVMHDIFIDPEKGGQAPRRVYEKAVNDGRWDVLEMTLTLGVLQRRA